MISEDGLEPAGPVDKKDVNLEPVPVRGEEVTKNLELESDPVEEMGENVVVVNPLLEPEELLEKVEELGDALPESVEELGDAACPRARTTATP